jgi:hypothetical protein
MGRPKGAKNKPRKLPFTQIEIMRAIRATQRMGFAVKHIVLNPLAGTITIEPAEKSSVQATIPATSVPATSEAA